MRLFLLAGIAGALFATWAFFPSLRARFASGEGDSGLVIDNAPRHQGPAGSEAGPTPSPFGERSSDAPAAPNRSAGSGSGNAEERDRPALGREEPRVPARSEPDRTETVSPGSNASSPGTVATADPAATPGIPRNTTPPADPGRGPGASRELQREMERIQRGREEVARNRPVDGRRTLSLALRSGVLPAQLAADVRGELARINERLIFSPEIVADDPHILSYVVESGDALSRLPRKLGVQTDWRFIQRINGIRSPSSIAVGRRLKMVTGPFHAVIHKSDFRLDLWLGDEHDPVFVRSFRVGLGADDGTPEGRFRVRPGSKLINPQWINPRTRERFLPDDPANPIGEHWIGLVGDEPHLAAVEGYGLHGTIEPQSIGTQSSMGCVRMLADDIALIYEVLTEPSSAITIRR